MPEAGAPPLPNISVRSRDSLTEACMEWDRAVASTKVVYESDLISGTGVS